MRSSESEKFRGGLEKTFTALFMRCIWGKKLWTENFLWLALNCELGRAPEKTSRQANQSVAKVFSGRMF